MVMEAPEEGEDDEMAQMAQLLGAMGGGGGAGGLPPGVVQVGVCSCAMFAMCIHTCQAVYWCIYASPYVLYALLVTDEHVLLGPAGLVIRSLCRVL